MLYTIKSYSLQLQSQKVSPLFAEFDLFFFIFLPKSLVAAMLVCFLSVHQQPRAAQEPWNTGLRVLTALVGTLIFRNSASLHSTGQGAWSRVKLGPWVFNWNTKSHVKIAELPRYKLLISIRIQIKNRCHLYKEEDLLFGFLWLSFACNREGSWISVISSMSSHISTLKRSHLNSFKQQQF